MAKPDLTYTTGVFWSLYPETEAGLIAWNDYVRANPEYGGAFKVPFHSGPACLKALRKAGYSVHQARPVPMSDAELLAAIDDLAAELV